MKILKILVITLIFGQHLQASHSITVIQYPLLNRPVIKLPGAQFVIECQASSNTSDWTAMITTKYFSKSLPISANYESSLQKWFLTATIPMDTPYELYNLTVSASDGIRDSVANAVRIIKEYKNEYYFLHLPDAHLPSCAWVGYYDDDNTVPEMQQLIKEFNIINPEFILQTGDLVDNGQNEYSYQIAQDVLQNLQIPIYISGGNHDLWYDGHNNWHKYFGNVMDYSFNYGSHHFSGLEMYDIPTVTFTAAQMNWLQQDLTTSVNNDDQLRVLFYHYDESHQIDDEFVDDYRVDLILYGHTHINGTSYVGTRGAININTSYTMNDNGEYRLIKVVNNEISEYPVLKFKNIAVRYSPTNDGTNWIVNAFLMNNTNARFEHGLIKFMVPQDAAGYAITGGTLLQIVPLSNDKTLYYINVNIKPHSQQTVTIQSQSPPLNWPPMITSYSPLSDTTVYGGNELLLSISASDNNGDALNYQWHRNGQAINGANSSNYRFVNDQNYEAVDTLTVVVSDGFYNDEYQWAITTKKFTGDPQVISIIGNFFPYNELATIQWFEPIPIAARLEYGTSPGDYSLGSIDETSENEVSFIPEDLGMSLGRYFCRITDGTYSSREFFIVIESPIAPTMTAPLGNIKTLTPVFSWEKVVGVPYYWVMVSDQEIIVGEDPISGELMVEGANPIWAVLTSENEVTYGISDPSGNFTNAPPPLIAGATYWWVVLNAYGDIPELTSPVLAGIAEFVIDLAPPQIDAPVLISPSNNDTLSGDIITFEWQAVSGAANYHVYPFKIERESEMETARPLWENIIATTNSYYDYPAHQRLVKGDYRWKIGAVDNNGLEVHSETRNFFYDAPAAVVAVHTFDDGGTSDDLSDDTFLPRTKVEYETVDGIYTGMPLSTDFHGNREYFNITPGTYIFTLSKDLYETLIDTFTFAENDTLDLNFRLTSSPSSIYGTVIDTDANPIHGATVQIVHSLHSELYKETSTDANGNFSVSLMGGTWQCTASKQGYQNSATVSISTSAGENVALPSPMIITKNTNTIWGAVINPDNQPIFGAEVTLTKGNLKLSIITNANGSFSFVVESGYWLLNVKKEGFISPAIQGISVSGGQTYQVQPNPVLTPNAAIISGHVTDQTKSLDSVLVKAVPTTGEITKTVTDVYGFYSMNLKPGTYRIIPQKQGYQAASEVQITLAAGETVSGLELTLLPNDGLISGKTTIDGITPLAGVKISAGQGATYTLSNGSFSLALTQGDYIVTASKEGYFSSESQSISVGIGQTVEHVDFILTPNASVIKGTVYGSNGPIYQAEVIATKYQSISTLTDEQGRYTLNLEAGGWNLRATKSGFGTSAQDSVQIGAGQTLSGLNFYLSPNEAYIIGTIKSSNNQAAIRDATVKIIGTDKETKSKSDGSFRLTVEPGSYAIEASKTGYGSASVSTDTLEANQTFTINFILEPFDCQIQGSISDENDHRIANALVFAINGDTIKSITNNNGKYILQLNAGDYMLDVNKAGYLNSTGSISLSLLPGEVKSNINFTLLSNFAGLKGSVTDSLTESPIINALIKATGPDHTVGSVYTDVTGQYQFLNEDQNLFLCEGIYSLTITKNGFETKQFSNIQLIGGATATQNIKLYPYSSLISGIVMAGSTKIARATINATHETMNDHFSVISDDNGNFVIDAIPTGNYYINAYKSGFTSLPDTLIAAGTTDLSLKLMPNIGLITGSVVDSKTGLPVSGAYLYADDNHGNFGNASSNMEGRFSITDLATLYNYTVHASKYGYESMTLQQISPLDSSTILFELNKIYGSISGHVVKSDNSSLADVLIKLSSNEFTLYDTTDTSGKYQFQQLPVGTYYLYAQRVGYLSNPQYLTANIYQTGEITAMDFIMDEAITASISIRGNKSINNTAVAYYTYDALTADGRTSIIVPMWSVDPPAAVDSISHQGLVDPKNDYVGPIKISVQDQYSGITGEMDVSVYQKIGKDSPVTTVNNVSGVSLTLPENCVDGDVRIEMKLPRIPDVRRYTDQYEISGDVYEFTPIGITFNKQLTLTLPKPAKEGSYIIGQWDQNNLTWDILNDVTSAAQSLSVAINQLGRFAVLNPTAPLSLKNIKLEPNPFSPELVPLNIYFDLNSNVTSHPFVTIKIYNMIGDLVRKLIINKAIPKGRQKLETWDGKTDYGKMALNGRYVLHLQAKDSSGNKEALKTVVLIK